MTPRLVTLVRAEVVTAPWTQVKPEERVSGGALPAQLEIEALAELEPPELEPPELEPPELEPPELEPPELEPPELEPLQLEKPAGASATGDMHTLAPKPP